MAEKARARGEEVKRHCTGIGAAMRNKELRIQDVDASHTRVWSGARWYTFVKKYKKQIHLSAL